MKLVFASPTYGPVDPQAVRSQRSAIMHAAQNGVEWLGDASPDRVGWEGARTAVVDSVLRDAESAEAIFWCDSDVILPPHAITSLVQAGTAFITGLYFQRKPPYTPQIYLFDERGGADGRGSFRGLIQWPEHVVAPVDGCGFGCVLTTTAMLQAIPAPRFAWGRFGEDFDFCLKARQAGFQLFVHTGVVCGHLADPVPVTVDDFRREMATWHLSPVRQDAVE